MKILQLIFSLSSGGAERFSIDLSNELSKNNEVYLCVIQTDLDKNLSFFKSQINERIKYINLGCTKGINFKTFFTIFKVLKTIKPDIVHAHLNTKIYLFLPSLLFKNRIKFVHTIHNLAYKDVGFEWQKRINNFFYKRNIISAVAISIECKTSFVEFYEHSNVNLVENGVAKPTATDRLYSVKKEIENLKNKKSDKVFIHIARYSEQKNQNLLITVFNRLIEEYQGVILVIIGNHFDTDSAKELRNSSKKGIFYLGPKINISDYLLISDAFILSSLWEGLPISLLEAMSCGVIPVCTPAGGIPDVIKDETLGYLSKGFTEQGLYDAAIKCINNMSQFDREFLKNYFNLYFSIKKCANEYQIIYN